MTTAAVWPDATSLIPDVLRSLPQARTVLNRYGLRGCGGPEGPVETLGFFRVPHEVLLPRLLDEIRREPPPRPVQLPVVDDPRPGDNIYRPFFKAGIAVVLSGRTKGKTSANLYTGDPIPDGPIEPGYSVAAVSATVE